jgi:SAM-dependent methyltransferase
VSNAFSVLIPFEGPSAASAAAAAAEALRAGASEVVLSGDVDIDAPFEARRLISPGGRGAAVRRGLAELHTDCTILVEPWVGGLEPHLRRVSDPVRAGLADVVLPAQPMPGAGAVAHHLARGMSELEFPLAPVRAVRTTALQGLKLVSEGAGIGAEILVKLAAQSFRFSEVPVDPPLRGTPPLSDLREFLATFFRYAFLTNDSDNAHEGYNTLERLEGAPHYNAWLGSKVRPHLGKRVLEVGAGIGTITRQIQEGREKVIALEADAYYAQRLSNLFRGSPVVTPLHVTVEETNWPALAEEQLDTVLLSNVLEHIDDDLAAARKFRSVLPPDGRLVLLVPALPVLFGSLDEAVGHHRRYTPETLRAVIEPAGFNLEHLEWLNLVGIAGWFLNGRVLKRRVLPQMQLKIYDRVAPLLARAEAMWKLPVGLSLLAVARATDNPGAKG